MYSTDTESGRHPLSFRIKKRNIFKTYKQTNANQKTQTCCKYKILRQLLVLEIKKDIPCNYSCKFQVSSHFLERCQSSSHLQYLSHFYWFFSCTYITPHQTFSVTNTCPEVFSFSFSLQVKSVECLTLIICDFFFAGLGGFCLALWFGCSCTGTFTSCLFFFLIGTLVCIYDKDGQRNDLAKNWTIYLEQKEV